LIRQITKNKNYEFVSTYYMGKNKDQKQHRTSHPPVVSVLGHVDHGKTSLLDAIRKSNKAEREAGGITQSIGASSVVISHEGKDREITFIDTPGHEAFANMRSHGVNAADVVLLVVASDDGVKPQTKESIDIISKSNLPYIVVFTKSDAPGANIEKAKQEILKSGILLEGLGGTVPYISVSAKTNNYIRELLDLILIVYDIQEIKKDEDATFQGVVIESQLDKRRGPVSAVVVKSGKLSRGIKLFLGAQEVGNVRALFNTEIKPTQSALPGDAVEILGITSVLPAGSVLHDTVQRAASFSGSTALSDVSSHDLLARIKMQNKEKLPIILKTRTSGEYEAIIASLPDDVEIIFEGRGDVSVSDIMMAKDFSAIVVGFNVKAEKQAETIAQSQNIFFRTYSIIYKMLEEIEDAALMLLESQARKIAGKAKVLAQFEGSSGTIIGIRIDEGRVQVGDLVQTEESETTLGKVSSIKHGKEDVKQVGKDKECGIMTDAPIDFTIGDVLVFVSSKK